MTQIFDLEDPLIFQYPRKYPLMAKRKDKPRNRSIIHLSPDEARTFLLKHESYCTVDLPPYFRFTDLLGNLADVLKKAPISDRHCKSARKYDDINYRILNNKDGQYAWRPLDLIHPALYVALVNHITEEANWQLICKRFSDLQSNQKIKCLSLPVESSTKEKDKAEQVTQWWVAYEQKSIELSLDYGFIIQTDVVDCYAAIYTHSIAWALHTKSKAKRNRTSSLIGNRIDRHIQDMRQGQTNGIPQGSVLMDFIAEMVLAYADNELTEKIKNESENYQILRYRDDYRIFVNNPQHGERILKCLTETMIDLGLKLGPSKTNTSDAVITSSLKKDRLAWAFRKQGDRILHKHLLIIHDHSKEHPNAGSVQVALTDFYKRLAKRKKYNFPLPLISIVTDIAYHNPKTYPISASILSKLVSFLESPSVKRVVFEKIKRKFSQIPNTGHMEIWLQRISYPFAPDMDFNEPLCQLVQQGHASLWRNDWIDSSNLRKAIDTKKILDSKKLADMAPVISIEEVKLYESY